MSRGVWLIPGVLPMGKMSPISALTSGARRASQDHRAAGLASGADADGTLDDPLVLDDDIARVQLLYERARAVSTSVVDHDHFEAIAGVLEDRGQLPVEELDHLLFVVEGNDDGDEDIGSAPSARRLRDHFTVRFSPNFC